jgi:hypothetical protein
MPLKSHPDGWTPEMYDRRFELPPGEVRCVQTAETRVEMQLSADHAYYVTVMPLDRHGESVGKRLYRCSEEIVIRP